MNPLLDIRNAATAHMGERGKGVRSYALVTLDECGVLDVHYFVTSLDQDEFIRLSAGAEHARDHLQMRAHDTAFTPKGRVQ